MKKRKKSFIGWTDHYWFLQRSNDWGMQKKIHHSKIHSKDLSTDKKVRITIEEI